MKRCPAPSLSLLLPVVLPLLALGHATSDGQFVVDRGTTDAPPAAGIVNGGVALTPTVTVVSPSFKVAYSYNADSCPNKGKTLSDSPPRAFRNSSGVVHLYSSENQGSRASVGRELNGSLARDCNVFYNSSATANKPDPALFEAAEWVQGAGVAPDGSIHALVHNEWHPDPGSAAGAYANCSKPDCWVSYITAVVSRDGGKSFQHAAPPPHHLVASLPEKYRDGWAGTGNGHAPYGFQNPSNILHSPLDGYHYALISTWGTAWQPGIQARQPGGNCLIRTKDLNSGPAAWRAWGGAAFNVSLNANPYTPAGATDPGAHICAPVTHTNEYLTLVWSTYYKQYMTVFGDGGCSTVSFKLSHDLITWSKSVVIRKCICKGGRWEVYPSLIDPASPSDSFDTIGKTASLFFVNLHGRQIWYYDLEFGGADEGR